MKEFTITCASHESLCEAVRNAKEGDVIGIEKGVYDMSGSRNLVLVDKRNVTLTSVTGCADDVVFKGSGFHKEGGYYLYKTKPHDEPVTLLSNCDQITISGITFRDCNVHGVKISGESNISNVTIDRCKFIDINERMIKGSKGSDDVRVPGMKITNNYFENTQIPYESDHMPEFRGDYVTAIDMMVLDDAVISGNTFVNIKGKYGNGRGAIFIWIFSKNITVENNVFIKCNRNISFGNPHFDDPEVGKTKFYVDGGVIRKNTIINATRQGIELSYTRGVKITENTIYCADATIAAIEDTGNEKERASKDLLIQNNVIRGFIDVPPAEIDKNIFINCNL